MAKGIPGTRNGGPGLSPTAESVVRYRKQGREPEAIIALARKHTTWALKKIVELANGKAGDPVRVLDKNGVVVEIDVEVPASVQLKACEIILERGYGKAPQAIMLGQDGSLGEAGVHLLPIAERILAIKAAREQRGNTTDLEASEQDDPTFTDVETSPVPALATPASTPQDLI